MMEFASAPAAISTAVPRKTARMPMWPPRKPPASGPSHLPDVLGRYRPPEQASGDRLRRAVADDGGHAGRKSAERRAHQKAQQDELPARGDERLGDEQERARRRATATTIRQWPIRSAIRPRRGADKTPPSAPADMASPETKVTRLGRRKLRDVDGDDRLDRGQREGEQEPGRQHRDDRAPVGDLPPKAACAAFSRACAGRGAFAQEKGRGEEAHKDRGAREPEGRADADQRRQRPADQRPDQVAGHDAGGEHAERPARLRPRGLRRDQDHRARGVAAKEAGQQAHRDELLDVLRHAGQRHRDRHAEARADQHELSSVAVAEPAPKRRRQRGGEEGRAIGDARPLHDRRRPGHADLLDVDRQERQEQRHRDDGRERAGRTDEQVREPVAVVGARRSSIWFLIGSATAPRVLLPFQSEAKRLVSTTGRSAAIASRALTLLPTKRRCPRPRGIGRRLGDRRIEYPSLFHTHMRTFSCALRRKLIRLQLIRRSNGVGGCGGSFGGENFLEGTGAVAKFKFGRGPRNPLKTPDSHRENPRNSKEFQHSKTRRFADAEVGRRKARKSQMSPVRGRLNSIKRLDPCDLVTAARERRAARPWRPLSQSAAPSRHATRDAVGAEDQRGREAACADFGAELALRDRGKARDASAPSAQKSASRASRRPGLSSPRRRRNPFRAGGRRAGRATASPEGTGRTTAPRG